MPDYSKITIEFLVDLGDDSELKLSTTDGSDTWDWVAARSSSYEVTSGSPTGTAGEITATNFDTAYLLDKPTGFTTSRTVNSLEITSQTEGFDFSGVKIDDENGTPLISGIGYNVTFENYVEPFDISTVQTILTRSPHYINTPFTFDTTTKATIDLRIYEGDFDTDEPVEPTRSLTIYRPTVDYTDFNTNISHVVANYLESVPLIQLDYPFQIVESNINEFKWVTYVASYTDPVEDIADVYGYLSAGDGYSDYMGGVNQNFSGVLTRCTRRKVDRNGIVLLPFLNNDQYNKITVTSYPSGYERVYNISYDVDGEAVILELEDTDLMGLEDGGELELELTAENINGYFIAYVQCDINQLGSTDTRVEVVFEQPDLETDTFIYDIVDECTFTPKTVVFKNKDGFYEALTLFAKSVEKFNVQKDQFVNNYVSGGTYSTTKHQIQDKNITAKKNIVCHSGHVKEAENPLYEEILLSQYVWFYEDGTLIPVRPTTSSFTYKTRVNDQLIEYQIDFEYAFNMINNV